MKVREGIELLSQFDGELDLEGVDLSTGETFDILDIEESDEGTVQLEFES